MICPPAFRILWQRGLHLSIHYIKLSTEVRAMVLRSLREKLSGLVAEIYRLECLNQHHITRDNFMKLLEIRTERTRLECAIHQLWIELGATTSEKSTE